MVASDHLGEAVVMLGAIRRQLARGLVLAAGLLLGAGSVALGSGAVFGGGGTLYACAKTVNGQLRLVQQAESCAEAEEAVAWNVQGPKGEAGDPGPQGPVGPKGDAGATLTSLDSLEGIDCTSEGAEGELFLARTQSEQWFVSFFCLSPDRHEPNDQRESATEARPLCANPDFNPGCGRGTIYPSGDVDWYVFEGSPKVFNLFANARAVDYVIYRDGIELRSGAIPAGTVQSVRPEDDGLSHRWEVRAGGGPAQWGFVASNCC